MILREKIKEIAEYRIVRAINEPIDNVDTFIENTVDDIMAEISTIVDCTTTNDFIWTLLSLIVPEKELQTLDVKEFVEEVVKMVQLYAKKNHDYGNAFSEIIAEVGLPYGVGKLKEKLKRIETLINSKAEVNESLEDSLIDLACYTVMTLNYIKHKKNK